MDRMRSEPKLGYGIYTVPDTALILDLPRAKIGRWIKKYWELEFTKSDACMVDSYTWGVLREKAFNFYTLIELIAVKSFRDLGLSFKKIKRAHDILCHLLDTPYPFATSPLLSDGDVIFLEEQSIRLLGIDRNLQYNFMDIVLPYCKKLDFDTESFLATRYWPLGKDRSIVVDPHHSFGQPTIAGTNITVFALLKLIQAGESKEFISNIFDINPQKVEDAILFGQRQAA